MKKQTRILITGSGGFVGKSLTSFIKKKKKFRILLDNKKKFDLSNLKDFRKLLKITQPQIIIHLAARTKPGVCSTYENKKQYKNTYKPVFNLLQSLDLLKTLKKIIFIGSIEEYGKARLPFKENEEAKPFSSYGKYKLLSFKLVKNFFYNKKKIQYIWLRPSLMFGFNDNKKRFFGTILNGVKNKRIFRIKLGKQIRDYLYVNDFNRFIYLNLIQRSYFHFNILNITNENWISLRSLLNKINIFTQGKANKYLSVIKVKNNTKFLNSGKLLKKNFPNFKFTNFDIALKKTIKNI